MTIFDNSWKVESKKLGRRVNSYCYLKGIEEYTEKLEKGLRQFLMKEGYEYPAFTAKEIIKSIKANGT